ncbi:MAG: four helix bundle protein [Candidatus Peribacteria bacterium]|jgi:hypothetical protein|nr:four helix bundle protein [Candidatus Peribacteria bacterium]
MTTYDHLPVYKASYDFLIKIFVTVKNFSKEYKYTIGEQLQKEAVGLVSSICTANRKLDKTEILILSKEKVELLTLYLRICSDMKLISLKKHVELTLILEDISKQLTDWSN